MRQVASTTAVKIKVLSRNEYFNELPEDVLAKIAERTQLREYRRGEVFFWEGDPCLGLHII